ncbi:MAG TPA: hypothetical protein VH599_17395 [Ktedonobacterales bacterium]
MAAHSSDVSGGPQCPVFIFKLRRNIALEGDLLLARMELEAFLPGKVETLDQMRDALRLAPRLAGLQGFGALDHLARPSGTQGYVAWGPLSRLSRLVQRVSFIQRIYCVAPDSQAAREALAERLETLGPVLSYRLAEDQLIIQALPHYALIELSDVIARHSRGILDTKRNLTLVLDAILERTGDHQATKLASAALSAQSTTSHLSHDIHYYKAKFFPRMARAMLNVCAIRLGEGPHRVLDNFVGSGTTLLEASLLGMPGVGLDIDPLSVMIAHAKLAAVHLESALLASEAAAAIARLDARASGQLSLFDPLITETPDSAITFPAWLMKNRRMSAEIAGRLSADIARMQVAIAGCDPRVSHVFRVLMSDAIARKIRMRFLGTGVGRFSLTFAKASLTQMFSVSLAHYVKVAATCEWLRQTIHLAFADTEIVAADTRNIPEQVGRFDIVVTSPPYLPASSGRESYAKARAPSLIALEMRNHVDVDDLVDDAIGSMDGGGIGSDELTAEERRVVDWLRQDELRAIKAEPTARYFLDMRLTFEQMYRALLPGALAVVVSGKTSTFYQFATRDPLQVVNVAEILADEAERKGFEVEALHDIQLDKANRNARPRSLDAYYETLIVLRKPTL